MGCNESQNVNVQNAGVVRVTYKDVSEPPAGISQVITSCQTKNFKDYYKLISILGFGSLGKVFKTKHLTSGNYRAVKIVQTQQLRSFQLRKVWKEIVLLKSLDHSHIIKAYESFTEKNRYCTVLELCQGGQLLKKILSKGNMTNLKELVEIMRQLLSAVYYCHINKVVHRNIRPQTILLTSEGSLQIKLIGFIYATKVNDQVQSRSDAENMLVPPLSYFSAPECSTQTYSEKSDIWACGMLLYLLLTGHTPTKSIRIRSNGKLKTQAFIKIKEDDFNLVESDDARELLKRMLHPNPLKRPTAQQCLAHQFLSKKQQLTKQLNLRGVIDKLRKFQVENTLERFVLMYTYHNLATIQQKEEYLTQFKKIDVNSDGFVTHQELRKALISIGISEQEAQQQSSKIFQVLDKNYNGVIDYSQYVTATIMSDQYVTPSNLESMFRLMDSGNKGFLRLNEISKVLDRKQMDKFKRGYDLIPAAERVNGVNIQQFRHIMMSMIRQSMRIQMH